MSTQVTSSQISNTLPKILDKVRNLKVAQSRFLKKINRSKERSAINPGGAYTPYTTVENDTAYGVTEGGAILGGAAPEYTIGSINIRSHWTSVQWTGLVDRTKNIYMTQFTRDADMQQKYSFDQLERYARNLAVKDALMSTLKTYARRENYFALQGTDKSPIGVITALPGGVTIRFSWDTTSQGNRMFNKNQQIEFRSPGGVIRSAGLSSSHTYCTVASQVDHTWQNGDLGAVIFDEIPSDLVVGDTAHFRNSYGLMPTGVAHYLGDSGTFKGITRSDDPSQFSSVVNSLTGSPTFAPIHVRELISQIQSKWGYDVPLELEFWMNKTQLFNWESQVYGEGFIRQLGPGQTQKLDMSVAEVEWDGKPFNIDVDVPPAQVLALVMSAWEKLVQTPVMPYEFDSGSYVINPIDSNGNRIDARMSTIFSEYNWDCLDARQGYIDGLGFDRRHI